MMTDPATYDSWYRTARGRWIGETEFCRLQRELAAHPGESILDVGCGSGYFSRRFARCGHPLVGADLDPAAASYTRNSGSPRISTVVADMAALPFPDRSVDCVIAVTSLCFVTDETAAVGEIVRVARRRFALGLLNRNSLLHRQKSRNAGGYAGARWHQVAGIPALFAGLPVSDLRVRTAILLPDGGLIARALERLAPAALPWGAFMIVTGSIGRDASSRA